MPRGAHVVLDRDRDARERPLVAGRVDRVRRGARLVREHEVERMDLAFAFVDSGQVLFEHVARRPPTGAYVGRDLDRGRHGASPRMRGTRKRPSSASGAWASTSSRGTPGTRFIGPEDVHERERMRGRRHVGRVQRGDLGRVIEDGPELVGQRLDLFLGQREARQLRDVLDVVPSDAGRHREKSTCTGRAC